MAEPDDIPAASGNKQRSWFKRATIAMLLLLLSGTSLMQDSLSLLLHFLLIFSVVFVAFALWRKRLGWLECSASIGLSMVLFGLLIHYLYLAPMRCEQPQGYSYALSLHRSGEVADHAQGSVDKDAGSISLSLSLNARPESRFAPIELLETETFRPAAGVTPAQLSMLSPLYVPDGAWVASAQPANVQDQPFRVWRTPLFQHTAEGFEPLGDFTGRIRTGAHTRVDTKSFRLLRSLKGTSNTTRKQELLRYNHDTWLDSVFSSGRAAAHLDRYRAIKDRCAPAWMFDEEQTS